MVFLRLDGRQAGEGGCRCRRAAAGARRAGGGGCAPGAEHGGSFRRRGQRGRRPWAASVRRTWRSALRSRNAEGGVSRVIAVSPWSPTSCAQPEGRTPGPAGGAGNVRCPGARRAVSVWSPPSTPAAEGYPEAPRRGAESRRRNISDQLEGRREGRGGWLGSKAPRWRPCTRRPAPPDLQVSEGSRSLSGGARGLSRLGLGETREGTGLGDFGRGLVGARPGRLVGWRRWAARKWSAAPDPASSATGLNPRRLAGKGERRFVRSRRAWIGEQDPRARMAARAGSPETGRL